MEKQPKKEEEEKQKQKKQTNNKQDNENGMTMIVCTVLCCVNCSTEIYMLSIKKYLVN